MSSSTEKQSNGRQQKGIHAGFKKAWRAIKNAFSSSGKNEVVSIPSSSHSEPSDVEEDLIIQTELRVFKQVCDQDVGDVLPGSCNVDQTLVEYTADPQPSSSGLHSAAPEHQPEKQTNGNKKKGRSAGFRKAWMAIKNTISRSGKNKVVPFQSPSHLEPCDVEDDPFLQEGLRVFKKVGNQDVDYFLSGSCYREQTPVEYAGDHQLALSRPKSAVPEEPSDLQPGSSGLQSSPSNKPTDHQPGPCGLQSVPSKSLTDHQPGPSELQSAPSKRPTDHQPGPSGLHSVPSKSPTDHQPGPSGLQSAPSKRPGDHQPNPSGLHSVPSKRQTDHQPGPSGLQSVPSKSQTDHQPGPSELQLAPFKRLTDHQPGPSGLQSVPLKSPTDHQPGPSGLQSAPSKRQSNHQPNPSGLHSVPSKRQTDHQPGPSGLQSAPSKRPTDHQPGPSGLQTAPSKRPTDHQPSPSGLQLAVREEAAHPQPRSFSLLYKLGSELGSGSYGTVYEGIRRSDGQKVAIKCIRDRTDILKLDIPGHIKPVFNEVAVNLQLHKPEKCPYIVQMIDWFEERNKLLLILEYPQPCVTMFDFVSKHQCGLDETLARQFMVQAAIAAKHLIDHGVNHGDIHTANVLVNTETLQIKLIDFGNSRLITDAEIPAFGYCDRDHADTTTVFGLADILYDMVHGFHNASVTLSEECIDLLNRSIFRGSFSRPTLEEFIDHKWFKQG